MELHPARRTESNAAPITGRRLGGASGDAWQNDDGGRVLRFNIFPGLTAVLIDHANWAGAGGRKGQIAEHVPAIDVSPENDWTAVRVGDGTGAGGFGRPQPTFGFIYP